MAAVDVFSFNNSLQQLNSELSVNLKVFGVTTVTISIPQLVAPKVFNYTPVAPQQEDADFGSDIPVFDDLDETLTLQSGRRVLIDALGRRLLTDKGSLPFHEDYGIDVRNFLNTSITTDSLFTIKDIVERELEDDERVLSASTVVTYDTPTEALSFDVTIQTEEGPFAFTLVVTALTTQLIAGE